MLFLTLSFYVTQFEVFGLFWRWFIVVGGLVCGAAGEMYFKLISWKDILSFPGWV